MQIVIDICESAYKEMCEYGTDRVDYDIQNMIKNSTVLPQNPTNGDMIKTMFPNASITEIGGGSTIVVANDYKFNNTWWNSPYERREG